MRRGARPAVAGGGPGPMAPPLDPPLVWGTIATAGQVWRCGGSCNRGTGEIGSVAGSRADVGVPVTAVQGRLVNEAG